MHNKIAFTKLHSTKLHTIKMHSIKLHIITKRIHKKNKQKNVYIKIACTKIVRFSNNTFNNIHQQ